MKIKHRQAAENDVLKATVAHLETRAARIERRAGIAVRALERIESWHREGRNEVSEEVYREVQAALLAQHRQPAAVSD